MSRRVTFDDPNIVATGLLQDMALLQTNERSRFGYKRAARIIGTGLDRSVADLIADGTFRDVPYLGASTERIVAELVETGRSTTVERAVSASAQRAEVEKRRGFRHAYLSRHAMRRVLDARMPPDVVSTRAYRGDLQMHSTWSDGAESVETLATAADALGWSRIGITDHSYGLPIARGMSMDAAGRQRREIDALNERLAGVRVYQGVEANILVDGSLDLQRDERGGFDYIIASPHSLLRRQTDQTARMVGAVSEAGVAILGHPLGRMYNSRPGVSADWDKVFREAARRDVAIEIDGNWHRQDMPCDFAARALDAGCLFALDSDAHSVPEFPFTDYAIAQARLAGIPAERVVNCWSEGRFDDWLRSRSVTRARARSSARSRATRRGPSKG